LNVLHAIILAIIEGLTEYLPVSSTGHMIIGSSLMGIAHEEFTRIFTVGIQFGAILSVVVLYWRRFFEGFSTYPLLVAGFIPAAIAGLLFKDAIDLLLENIGVVAAALFIGGIVLLFIDRWFPHDHEDRQAPLGWKDALFIGCFQVIAMVPGISRSAATIIGGLTRKLSRAQAAEFSFLLAVPTMCAATAKTLWDHYQEGGMFTAEQWKLFGIGNAVAFVVAALAIKGFVGFLNKHGFKPFGWYRIGLGALLLALLWAGVDLRVI
jgi:undecaprenyl-diphosphatase